MPAPVNNNTPVKARTFAEKRAEKTIHTLVEEELSSLDYAHKKLAEDLILSYVNEDRMFNEYKSTFIKRFKYLYIRIKDPRSFDEALHLISQFILLDRIRRSVGISLKEIRTIDKTINNGTEMKESTDIYKNPSIISPYGLPKELNRLLQVPSENGRNYLEYIKKNVERIVFADFSRTKELKEYEDIAGVSDPISRTSLINTMTFYGGEDIPVFYWAMASTLVHEAAHIEWDWSHKAEPENPAASYSAERYAYIIRYDYLNSLLSNAGVLKLEKQRRNIERTMDEIRSVINQYNRDLGYKINDLLIK